MQLYQLCAYLGVLDARGYTRATSGNHSVRQSPSSFAITRSGLQKGEVTPQDFLIVDLNGQVLSCENGMKPSDETGLHIEIYRKDSLVNWILHVHSVAGTALSMVRPYSSSFSFCGFEMQKAIFGCLSHESRVDIPILENSQDIPSIVEAMRERWIAIAAVKAFYLRGHGLYTWAENLDLARRSLEAIEFLLEVSDHQTQPKV